MMRSASSRVVLNTIAQYIKTVINIVLSLYSTRLILQILGAEDYGIYSLVGGVVAMLSFITNALITTTQRFISYYNGKNDSVKLKQIFNNSLILHLCLGTFITIAMLIVGCFLFDGFLSIQSDRIYAAKWVYNIVVFTIFVTFVTAPFKALLVSHENIIYISIIDIIDGVFKVFIALFLYIISYDKLIVYSILLGLLSLFNLAAFLMYALKKYDECSLPSFSLFNYSYIKELFSFAWWNIYSTGCIVGRTQGVAIIINKYFGAVLNAAYGVAFSVSSAIQFVSSSLCNAMNPQIMKAEGSNNRSFMLRLAEIESKFGFLLISIVGIPCYFEMETILKIWLGTYPDYAVFFSQMVLVSAIIDQLTVGLTTANQAIGKIKTYSLFINSIKLVTLPIVILCLHFGYGIHSIMYCYCIFEFICAIFRLPFLKKTAGLSISSFISKVFVKEIIPVSVSITTCLLISQIVENVYLRLFLVFVISVILSGISILLFSLCDDEKQILYRLFNRMKK